MVRIYEALQQAARERGPDRRIMNFPAPGMNSRTNRCGTKWLICIAWFSRNAPGRPA